MKNTAYLILSMVLAITLISACGKDIDKTAESEVLNLKFNDWNPDGTPATLYWKDVAKMVEKKTKGRIRITNYLSGTLLKFPQTFNGVSTGIADISLYLLGATPGVHELNEIFDIPLLGFKNYEQAFRIYNEILNEFPELQEENESKNVRILSIRPMPPYWIHSTKKNIKNPEDMKGEKIIATGYYSSMASYGGGIAIQPGPADWYNDLKSGFVQHIITHFTSYGIFKLNKVATYHTQFSDGGCGNSGMAVLINLDIWKKISTQDRAILIEAYNWYQESIAKADLAMQHLFIHKAKKAGHIFMQLTPDEVKQWIDTGGKVAIEKWIAKTEAKNKPAKKIYEAVQAKIAKYNEL
ncbi:MAG: TRAP transporter substrate-binding protein DctP [Spirochaetes bacterium]|nr:TRAP transporter substrate-binding protein DctP [Spirochaetota bacterium]